MLKLTGQMTVARMMERDTFKNRFRNNRPIGIHEFLYPLMQGYDSVCVTADVELGGTDQMFNNLVGRDLQEKAGIEPQVVMTMPILRGLDGNEKMSKSMNNYISVNDTATDMFGKVMSIPDDLTSHYFLLLTTVSENELSEWCDENKTHPRDAKAKLAGMIVEQFHGKKEAAAAEEEFNRVFRDSGTPDEVPEFRVDGGAAGIVDLIAAAGLADSKGEAKRLVKQNAVSLDGERITDIQQKVEPKNGAVLKVGKRRFCRLKLR